MNFSSIFSVEYNVECISVEDERGSVVLMRDARANSKMT